MEIFEWLFCGVLGALILFMWSLLLINIHMTDRQLRREIKELKRKALKGGKR